MSDNRKKKLKDRKRVAFKEARDRIKGFPKFKFSGTSVSPGYLSLVRSAFEKVRADLTDVLMPLEIENINSLFNGTGGRLKQRARGRVRCGLSKLGDAAYEHVMKSYTFPVGTYSLKQSTALGVIEIQCSSFKEAKSTFGTRYYSESNPIIVTGNSGILSRHVMGYTRHFLERAMERDFLGTPLERHRSLYRCLDNPVVLVDAGRFYRLYARSAKTGRAFMGQAEQMAGRLDGSELYHFLGYLPFTTEGKFIVPKTLLLPGMDGTPEKRLDGLDAGHFLDREYLGSLAEVNFPIGLLVDHEGNGSYRIRTLDVYNFRNEAVRRTAAEQGCTEEELVQEMSSDVSTVPVGKRSEQIDQLLDLIEELPEEATGFAESVEEKLKNMQDWIITQKHVTNKMEVAIENIATGMLKWLENNHD